MFPSVFVDVKKAMGFVRLSSLTELGPDISATAFTSFSNCVEYVYGGSLRPSVSVGSVEKESARTWSSGRRVEISYAGGGLPVMLGQEVFNSTAIRVWDWSFSLARKAWIRSIMEARSIGELDVMLMMMGLVELGGALERMVSTCWR